jgi:ubiquinone biosynthesis protein Coq4
MLAPMLVEQTIVDDALKAAWEAVVDSPEPTPAQLAGLVETYRRVGPPVAAEAVDDQRLGDALWASVLMARVAFAAPEAGLPVYDDLAADFLEGIPLVFGTRALGPEARRRLAAPATLAAELRPFLWAVIEGGVDPAQITPRIAALGAAHPQPLRDAFARAMREHPGFDEFRTRPAMPRLTLERLAASAPDSLGQALHRLIVDNGYDIEVLDPETVAGYHPELDGPNRYILQTHEVWHLVAGYSTSPGHEVAISGFQLAQFGHPYSRDFLAAIVALTTFTAPAAACFVIQLALEGWRHGRQTRPLTLVDWDERFDDPVDTIRTSEGIEVYRSLIPDVPLPAGA